METPAALMGSHSRSSPIAMMSWSRRCTVDAIVTSRIGSAKARLANAKTLGACAEVARHWVDPGVQAGDTLDQEAVVDVGDQLRLRPVTGNQSERLCTDTRRALEAGANC
jgi:hypothetical protein